MPAKSRLPAATRQRQHTEQRAHRSGRPVPTSRRQAGACLAWPALSAQVLTERELVETQVSKWVLRNWLAPPSSVTVGGLPVRVAALTSARAVDLRCTRVGFSIWAHPTLISNWPPSAGWRRDRRRGSGRGAGKRAHRKDQHDECVCREQESRDTQSWGSRPYYGRSKMEWPHGAAEWGGMQTASIECNSRVEAYLQHQRSMSSYVACLSEQEHWGTIERLFAESFPDATAQARRVARQLQLPSSADSEDDVRHYFGDAIDIQGGEPTPTPTQFGGDADDLPRSSGASVPVDERRHDLGHDQDFPFTSDYPPEVCMILQGVEAGFDAHSAFSEVDRGKYCDPADVFHADGNWGARDGNEPLTNSKEE
ncbi:hypothetical protein Purlil1_13245 [Purpureocillium lilacinum]|uniref:Retrotransposon gag domain-containing protein n=1 Tax=Purpureocillium lilacinum TaxID=33203 RepID=A0ABR0BEL4_PURLI|nr:hypothetical protein Purlil1_13245 [Purpureocillium lilacinum]